MSILSFNLSDSSILALYVMPKMSHVCSMHLNSMIIGAFFSILSEMNMWHSFRLPRSVVFKPVLTGDDYDEIAH